MLLALSCFAGLGLASGEEAPENGGAVQSPFPDRKALEALGPGPELSDLLSRPTANVAEWKLGGPLPDQAGVTQRAAVGEAETLLAEAVAKRPGIAAASESMHCVARELGRFALAHEALPDAGVVEFIAARCGSVGRGLRPAFLASRVPPGAQDAEILGRWRQGLESLLASALSGAPVEAGLWFGREGDRAVLLVASSTRGVVVEPFSMVADGGAVTIRGETLEPVESVLAQVNRGRFGFAGCVPEENVYLPRFAFRCALEPGDTEAAIDVSVQPAGRLLSNGVLHTLARTPGNAADTYRRTEPSTGPAPTDPAALAEAVQAAVNGVRKRASLPPLTLSKTQSEDAAALAPHLFASSLGLASPAIADLVALGLSAGWRVGGPIKDVEITSGYTPGSRDVGLWLDTVLRRPHGRAALLGERASVLAVGGVSSENPPALAAVAIGYELFGKEDFAADARRLLLRIAKARPEGAKAPAELPADARKAVEEAARAVREDHVEPGAALDQALAAASQVVGRRLQGWVLQGSSLESLPLPPELTALEAPELAVGVGFTQPEDAPWARYVVLVVAAEPDVAI